MGLTQKTATNLGLQKDDYPEILDETIEYFDKLLRKLDREDFKDSAWLLLEVESKRGRIRIEVGLISAGNQEVIEDKIACVGRNGIVLFDKLGTKTRVYQTAENYGVKLVQIRNSKPLLDVYRHLSPLVKFELNEPPSAPAELEELINRLPEEIFTLPQ